MTSLIFKVTFGPVWFQEVQILKALVLGEEERGQSQYQVMCFVTHISKEEFISSDAISKLRQVRQTILSVNTNIDNVVCEYRHCYL